MCFLFHKGHAAVNIESIRKLPSGQGTQKNQDIRPKEEQLQKVNQLVSWNLFWLLESINKTQSHGLQVPERIPLMLRIIHICPTAQGHVHTKSASEHTLSPIIHLSGKCQRRWVEEKHKAQKKAAFNLYLCDKKQHRIVL